MYFSLFDAKKMLDESLFQNKLHPTSSNTIFFFFFEILQILKMSKPVQHFIQHGKIPMLDEMLDWFAAGLTHFIDFFPTANINLDFLQKCSRGLILANWHLDISFATIYTHEFG